MSEKSKGDTSSSSTLAQIKNNPLLSASVTGMLLDDFPNKPLLLPAAPVIVTARPARENPTNKKTSDKTVTVGETPDIDAEQFSEINLNSSSDDLVPFSLQSDINDNPFPQIQHEPPAHSPSEFADESILSQAASSFSQLPSVASTVLSTFSKVINNYTPTSQATSRETSSERDLVQNTQAQQQFNQQQIGLDQYPSSNSSAQSTTAQIDPPTFFTSSNYADHQKPPIPGPQLPPPLTVGSATAGNTYRLTTKKKTYAQIPGLSKQLDQNIPEKNLVNQPPLPSKSPNSFEIGEDYNRSGYPTPPLSQQSLVQTDFSTGSENFGSNNYTVPPQVTAFQQPKPEDTTPKLSGLFSLSNIVPPVIQNLTGFVKSTVTGSSEPVTQQQRNYHQQDQNQSSIHFFDSTVQQPVTPPTVGFTPPEVNLVNPVNIFVPGEGGNSALVSSGQIGFESIQSSVNPPPLQTAPPPKPPQAAGTSSFRLQKGTRLYKSPFDQQSTAPSAPSIQAAFSQEPLVSQPPHQVSNIFKPISQTSTNPPSIVSGLKPLQQSEGGTNLFTPINTTASYIESNNQQEITQVPLYNPLNNQQKVPQHQINDSFNSIPQFSTNPPPSFVTGLPPLPKSEGGTNFFAPINTTASFDESNKQQEITQIPLFNPLNIQQHQVSESFKTIPQTVSNPPASVVTGLPPLPQSEGGTNFFTSIKATSSFVESNKQEEVTQVPLFNPINNQQKVAHISQIFNPINQPHNTSVFSETTQLFNPLNQQQNIPTSTENQNSAQTQIFNPINQLQNTSVSPVHRIPETNQHFNPINLQNISASTENQVPEKIQIFNPLNQSYNSLPASQNNITEPIQQSSAQKQISAPLNESKVSFLIQNHPTDPIPNSVQENTTLFGSEKLLDPPAQAAIFNPPQERQSPANFFQNLPPQQTTIKQSNFFGSTDNFSQNTALVPNFPPPPVEKPEPKEDEYDSVPLQPPSIDQKPIEPLIQNTSQLPDLQPNVIKSKLPVGPPQPPISNQQQGSNPFRRSSILNSKLTKTVTPLPPVTPTLPSQFSESSQLSSVNFFNPQQLDQPGGISKEIIVANTINFPTEQQNSEDTELFPDDCNLISSSISDNSKIEESVVSSNIKQIENLQKNTTDPIKNLKTEKDISVIEESSHSISQFENCGASFKKDNSNLLNYFGNVSESTELNNFSNVISSSSTTPITTNIIHPTAPESISINKFSEFENQLKNKFDNSDQSYQSEQSTSVSDITNYFGTNNQNQINNKLDLQPKIPALEAEENFNYSKKSTPEKLEKSQQNLFPNYFTSIKQQQSQNIEKQTDFLQSTNLTGNSQIKNILPKSDPSTFFDSFNNNSGNSSVTEEFISDDNKNQILEDPNSQRIQNFFNNPPPQNLGDSINDLSYNFYGSGDNQNIVETTTKEFLTITNNNNNNNSNDINRPLTPASNLVEPPESSACSEFSSDFNNSLGGQQQQYLDYLKKLSTDELPDEILEQLNMAKLIPAKSTVVYQPAPKHWFFKKTIDSKLVWTPFSHKDSAALEECFHNDGTKIIPVEGGRYDINIKEKTRTPVYWNGDSSEVRRCSWFFKAIDSKYVPYDELTADLLESEYKNASNSGEWHKKVALETGETVVFHGPTVMVHFLQSQIVDAWGGATQSQSRPRIVKRDLDDFIIEPGETNKVDHLLFMVHGIGSGCDLKFRSVEEVVEEFRSIAYQLVQSHYKNSCDLGEVGRVEVLPVSWHDELHSKESGIDEKLKAITLESIPRLRNFANDTVLDVLFYTSPVFCQSIINTVANCMNRVYLKYCQRNTNFNGQISLAGHSLGSLILFDLLCHQKPIEDNDIQNSENPDHMINQMSNRKLPHVETRSSQKQVSYTIGSAGTGQPFINYPQLLFAPKKFFALGSPIGMFVTIRGIDSLGLNFKLPTCPGFYNIFHPYDPVAYRVEALINPELSGARPVLIPHHKGRKRMHLELKETMARVGTEVKQKIVETFKNTMESVFFMTPKNLKTDAQEIEEEVDKVLELQLKMDVPTTRIRTESSSSNVTSEPEAVDIDLPLGKLNDSKRIDYVLQEAPLEFFNEYLFALTSHVCYWESADTILFVVKEIYSSLGITTDSQVPQQTMTIERPNSADVVIS